MTLCVNLTFGFCHLDLEQILCVTNLTKVYDGFTAVDAISFEVHAGETVALLGSNGAGKTTTLQMILGLLEPTSGNIEVFSKPLGTHRVAILKRMNFAASYLALAGNLTVAENLRIFSMLYGVRNAREKINELIALFRLEQFRNILSGMLSSGEQSRLNLAKAFLNDPQLLLLDEPTASLDPAIARDIRAIIKERQQRLGAAILWTSHNMREIELMCDRILFLSHGRIVARGTHDELKRQFETPDLEELFVALVEREEQIHTMRAM